MFWHVDGALEAVPRLGQISCLEGKPAYRVERLGLEEREDGRGSHGHRPANQIGRGTCFSTAVLEHCQATERFAQHRGVAWPSAIDCGGNGGGVAADRRGEFSVALLDPARRQQRAGRLARSAVTRNCLFDDRQDHDRAGSRVRRGISS